MIFKEDLAAVIVLYHPVISDLLNVISVIEPTIARIYLIDNTPETSASLLAYSKTNNAIRYIPLNGNRGIAAAQNIGFREIKSEGRYKYVFQFDQDSCPDQDMITELCNGYDALVEMDLPVGVIGPISLNKDTNEQYKLSDNSRDYVMSGIMEKSELMSSGSLISLKTLEGVGLMEEELFIDGVDSEWCWRAIAKGYKCFIHEKAVLNHKLGEGDRKLLGISIAISSQFRTYYQFRNFIILAGRKYVPTQWKIKNGFKFLVKLFYYPIFLKGGRVYAKNIARGIRDGIAYRKAKNYIDLTVKY
ncbi:glycosyltransferase family 2 protein [Chitinophaga sp. sic0106]|uniref:glycosyltransferase family 2 protein n=1 Tax=Chitinophaga sp. sic0106 TaxID=2854785 RepID=UPI001C43796B|nr:glycosyltransferase family 2 protein [Chitinophaga sp. sic0106]MBV7529002.1 glycosyltransferase family 2 protein [Chitinophaga sp. sic0106]